MSDKMTCDEALRRITIGEPGVEAHLLHCASCRSEVEAFRPIIRAIQAEPLPEVRPRLDRAIYRAIAGRKQTVINRLSARIALILSATATVSLLAGIAITLPGASRPRHAILQGIALVLAYVAVSSVATLPLFTRRRGLNREAGSWT